MVTKEAFTRARAPAQREQRRQELLSAARRLLDAGGLEAVGLNAIAREAGIAKSNCYRYFESREQILLTLLTEDEAEWVAKLELELAPLAGTNDVERVAAIIAGTLAAEPRLCLLTSVVAGVLEQNVSEETARGFKQEVRALALRIANALFTAIPQLPTERIMAIQRYVHALIAGMWPMAHPSKAMQCVLAAEEFEHFRTDFEADLRGSLTALFRGSLSD
ncbi:MAG: TetR family transcriptional regulator [Polyangiaceae bacterium]|nr:TetR family transcriptional regulator [Myxococcales bacterium]MCB9590728.1 TetR family transcriptional regulator [Polyangiaceae bacterium]